MKIVSPALLGILFLPFGQATAQSGDSLATQVLDQVVIIATQPESDTLQNFYRSSASATTETIMSRMSGISLVRRGAYGQEAMFRGMKGGQLNVTIDGMKMFSACTDKMDPVTIYIEPIQLSAIQMIPGTKGSSYGSTFGGTLNLRTAEPAVGRQPVSGKVGADYQTSARAVNTFSRVNLSGRESAYYVSALYRKGNDYTAGGGETIDHSGYEKFNASVGGKWTLSSSDTLQASALFDQGWNIGFPALPMDTRRATAGIFSVTWHRTTPLLFFRNLTVKSYHNTVTHLMDDRSREVALHMDMPGSNRTSGIFAEGDVHLFHHHRTFARIEYFANDAIGEMTMYADGAAPMYMQTAPGARRQDAGLFFAQYFRLNDKNKMSLSWRADFVVDKLRSEIGRQQWEVFETALANTSNRFASTVSSTFTHKLKGNVALELELGYGERVPTQNERFGYYLFDRFDGYDYLGNPGLKKERSLNTALTFQYFGNSAEVQITPYYQRLRHYILGTETPISAMTPGAHGVKQFANYAWAGLAGVDMTLLARPVAPLLCIATLKYTRGRYAGGEPMPLIPPLKTVTSLRYDFARAYVHGEWESAAAQKRVSVSTGEIATNSWSVINLRTGWNFNALLTCSAGVENILDTNYREHLDWGAIPRSGRNYYLTATYNF